MKRDKFKKMRLWLETMKPAKADDCALLLKGLTMETSETSNFSMESVEQKKRELKNGILSVEMEARGIRTDDKRLAHLKTGRQAEILDYNYFKSRMPEMVITDIQAEVFDFRKNRVVPFAVKRLEFSFGNGKKVDMTGSRGGYGPLRKIAGRSGRAAILWLLFHVTGKGGWIGKEKLYWLSFYDKIDCMNK